MVVTGWRLTQSLNSLQGGYREYLHLQRRRRRFQEVDWRVQTTLRVGGGVKKQVVSLGQNPSPSCPSSHCPPPPDAQGGRHCGDQVTVTLRLRCRYVSPTRRSAPQGGSLFRSLLAFQGPEWSPAQSKRPMTVCGVNSGKYERTL